jgi:hypothetical protein
MDERSLFLGRLGAITQITFALLVSAFSLFSRQPDFVPRWVVVASAYAMPGVIALIGLAARRPALLVAGGLASALGSVAALSGVTLIFLVPAALLLAGAMRLAEPAAGPSSTDRRVTSALGVVAQAVVGAAIVALLVGGGGAALLLTDAGCWITHDTAGGNRVEVLPYSTGEMALPGDAVSGGCTDGLISARGVGIGGAMSAGALALAILAGRRRDRGDDVTGGPRTGGRAAPTSAA